MSTTMQVVIGLIAVAVLVFFIGLIVRLVLAWMKGSITIHLTRQSVQAGEAVEGKFQVKAKKVIIGEKLTASIFCQKITETRHDDKCTTRCDEIYRQDVTIDGPRTYTPGETAEFDLVLPTPAHLNDVERAADGGLARTLDVGMDMLSGRRTKVRFEWWVDVRLFAEGVDLNDRERVYVNFTGC